jgi:hypothetical protein
LHIDKVKLPTTAKTKCHDGLMSCLMSNPGAPPNAWWTSCGKHFTHPPWNARPKFCLDCIKKLIPFHVCATSNVHSSNINKACATARNTNILIYWRQSTTFIGLLSVHKNSFVTRHQVDNIKYVDVSSITTWMLLFELANCGTIARNLLFHEHFIWHGIGVWSLLARLELNFWVELSRMSLDGLFSIQASWRHIVYFLLAARILDCDSFRSYGIVNSEMLLLRSNVDALISGFEHRWVWVIISIACLSIRESSHIKMTILET